MISSDPGVWVAAFFLIATWSYVFKETMLWRIAENAFIGIGVGHLFIMGLASIQSFALLPLSRGNYAPLVPIVLGVLIYGMVSKGTYWISRFPVALLIGVTSGLAIRGMLTAQIVQQLTATIEKSVITANPLENFNNLLVTLIVLSVITYFYFTFEIRGPVGYVTRFGRYAMMIAFGAQMGGEVFARSAMMINRLIFVMKELLGII